MGKMMKNDKGNKKIENRSGANHKIIGRLEIGRVRHP
jgi:hypothetical protein